MWYPISLLFLELCIFKEGCNYVWDPYMFSSEPILAHTLGSVLLWGINPYVSLVPRVRQTHKNQPVGSGLYLLVRKNPQNLARLIPLVVDPKFNTQISPLLWVISNLVPKRTNPCNYSVRHPKGGILPTSRSWGIENDGPTLVRER